MIGRGLGQIVERADALGPKQRGIFRPNTVDARQVILDSRGWGRRWGRVHGRHGRRGHGRRARDPFPGDVAFQSRADGQDGGVGGSQVIDCIDAGQMEPLGHVIVHRGENSEIAAGGETQVGRPDFIRRVRLEVDAFLGQFGDERVVSQGGIFLFLCPASITGQHGPGGQHGAGRANQPRLEVGVIRLQRPVLRLPLLFVEIEARLPFFFDSAQTGLILLLGFGQPGFIIYIRRGERFSRGQPLLKL